MDVEICFVNTELSILKVKKRKIFARMSYFSAKDFPANEIWSI